MIMVSYMDAIGLTKTATFWLFSLLKVLPTNLVDHQHSQCREKLHPGDFLVLKIVFSSILRCASEKKSDSYLD